MKSGNISYLPKLDHLRFFAALLVIVYHYYFFQTGFYTQFKDPAVISKKVASALILEGQTGVSLFLVLSGFIFAAIGYGRKIDYWRFVQNRLLRIMPLYGAFIAVGAMLAHGSLSQFVGSVCFLSPMVPGVNYTPLTPHLWTISVEFQFYMLFPFIAMFMHRYGLLRYAVSLVGLVLLARALIFLGPKDMSPVKSLLSTLLGRLDQFVIGMVGGAAFSGRAGAAMPRWVRHPGAFVGAVALVLGVIYVYHQCGGYHTKHLHERHWWWIGWSTVEALAWLGVVVTYTGMKWDWPAVVSKGLAWLGSLSYSLYVTHWLFVHNVPWHKWIPQLSGSMTTNAALSVLLVVLPVIVGVSWLVFEVVERPFFELRRSYLIKDGAEADGVPK
jgi:peptidoglycan/LPS O-acetylase OafA/YrhL